MPNTPVLNFGDNKAEQFAKDLGKVMKALDKRLIDVVAGAQTARDVFDANAILNSRPAMIQALNDAGYYELASAYVAEYPEMVATVSKSLTARKLPKPEFSLDQKQTFRQMAGADFEQFAFIGESALDELRFGLHSQAIAGQPFSAFVESIAAATIGVDGKGSPLSNHAATHANTAILSFGGETIKEAGKAIGAEHWEVVGPLDQVTRDVCVDALSDPIRTEEEWQDAGYWGGTPGGWNCRHQLYPVIE